MRNNEMNLYVIGMTYTMLLSYSETLQLKQYMTHETLYFSEYRRISVNR